MQSTIFHQGTTEKSVVPLSIKCVARRQDYSFDTEKLWGLVASGIDEGWSWICYIPRCSSAVVFLLGPCFLVSLAGLLWEEHTDGLLEEK